MHISPKYFPITPFHYKLLFHLLGFTNSKVFTYILIPKKYIFLTLCLTWLLNAVDTSSLIRIIIFILDKDKHYFHYTK